MAFKHINIVLEHNSTLKCAIMFASTLIHSIIQTQVTAKSLCLETLPSFHPPWSVHNKIMSGSSEEHWKDGMGGGYKKGGDEQKEDRKEEKN